MLSAQPQPPSLKQISVSCRAFLDGLKHSSEELSAIQQATSKQRECQRWFEERRFRLTASKFGLVIQRQRNHSSLTTQLLYKASSNARVAPLLWGQQHESDAIDEYKKKLSHQNTVREAGIFISDCGFLGASPDGLVDHLGSPITVLEVKCPYKARNMTVTEMCVDKSFYCSLDENFQPVLKRTHEYYYQVQGQMATTKIHQCDFVIWTPKQCVVETIEFDEKFWNDTCYPKLRDFYFNFVLPEIVYPKHPDLPFDYSSINLYT